MHIGHHCSECLQCIYILSTDISIPTDLLVNTCTTTMIVASPGQNNIPTQTHMLTHTYTRTRTRTHTHTYTTHTHTTHTHTQTHTHTHTHNNTPTGDEKQCCFLKCKGHVCIMNVQLNSCLTHTCYICCPIQIELWTLIVMVIPWVLLALMVTCNLICCCYCCTLKGDRISLIKILINF